MIECCMILNLEFLKLEKEIGQIYQISEIYHDPKIKKFGVAANFINILIYHSAFRTQKV